MWELLIAALPTIVADAPQAYAFLQKYGPSIEAIVKTQGPALEQALGPLISASAQNGKLEIDAKNVVAAIQTLLPKLGGLETLADLAIGLASISSDTTAVPESNAVPIGMDNGPVQQAAKNGGV
jgi:hypothetical protein